MTIETTYTAARANLASLCDEVSSTHGAVIIKRRGAKDVALVSAEELSGLMETAHLLRSPKNARRLLATLTRAQTTKRRAEPLDKIRRELGLGEGR
jgi:antitoxin YefM